MEDAPELGAQKTGLEPGPKSGKPLGEFLPSPTDTDAAHNLAVEEVSQRKRSAAAIRLHAFAKDIAAAYKTTVKGDPNTNIIDQGEKIAYAMPKDVVVQLWDHLEACRLEKSIAHFSQRQGRHDALHTGIMLDYDLLMQQRTTAVANQYYQRIATAVVTKLVKDLDLKSGVQGRAKMSDLVMHAFFIVRQESTLLPNSPAERKLHKYGVHLLLPGVKLERSYKKWAYRQLREDPSIMSALSAMGASEPKCLDLNSASVPVLYFGSCKKGGLPYILGSALEFHIDLSSAEVPITCELISQEVLSKYNLVAELDLIDEAEYKDGRAPLVRKVEYKYRPELEEKVRDYAERARGGVLTEDEILLAEHGLISLTLADPDARLLHGCLDLLPEPFYTEYTKWRDVIYALASNEGKESYKPLAEWFSQKCPAKWADGGRAHLDSLWDEAVTKARQPARNERVLTRRSIMYWARQANPGKYEALERAGYYRTLLSFVFEYGGKLEHYMIAQILHIILGTKFRFDMDPAATGLAAKCWYEFVLSGQTMKPGEVWKWRREVAPDEINKYMSVDLPIIMKMVKEFLTERRTAATTEEQTKYYKALLTTFALESKKLLNHNFKADVIKECETTFRQRGFVDQLDKHGGLIGIGNGVLVLGAECRLVNYFHEYPVSRFTLASWRRFDPEKHAWDRIVQKTFEDVIPELDARERISFFLSSSLDGNPKEGFALLWLGGGANGKTTVLKSVGNALGKRSGGGYADKLAIALFTADRESADKPNSALMALKDLRFGYVEELNKSEKLNTARMKEIVNPGVITGSEKHKKQESFLNTCVVVLASQFSFIIDTRDHGTWRRLDQYVSKVTFKASPDPKNPYEKREDPRFVREYPDDPGFLEAMFSYLVHYYERLHREYGGQVKNVHSPTIRRETEKYRNSQDVLNRFISERIVISPEYQFDYTLSTVGSYFVEWFSNEIDRNQKHVAAEIVKDLENSVLSKYLVRRPHQGPMLSGCRILTDEKPIADGEEYLAEVEMRGRPAPVVEEPTAEPEPVENGNVDAEEPWREDDDEIRKAEFKSRQPVEEELNLDNMDPQKFFENDKTKPKKTVFIKRQHIRRSSFNFDELYGA